MSLRLSEKVAFSTALVVGAALTPGTISDDAGRLVVTFLGLVAASILPTITLIVNSMTASSRSVQAINSLDAELRVSMDALFLLFGCVGIVVAALIALSVQPPDALRQIPYVATDVLPRAGQAIALSFATLIVLRLGQIPGILRRTLEVRRQIAVDEARAKLDEKAPSAGEMRRAFSTHPDFGKPVPRPEARN